MEILFSVIIPTYNRALSLQRALDGLVSQTFKNFEIIISDDGSTDNTKEIVSKYEGKLNIKYRWCTNWGGPAKPRNIGVSESTGEWICFLDSDDWWYPAKLEECSKFVSDYDLIYHSLDIYDDRTDRITNKKVGRRLGRDVLKDLLLNGNGIANSSVVMKRSILEAIGDISEERSLIAVEDYDLWIRTAKVTDRFKFIKHSLGAYLWDSSSNISRISPDRIAKEELIFTRYVSLLDRKYQLEATRIFHYKLGRYYGVLEDYTLARKYLASALLSRQFSIKCKSFAFYSYYSLNKWGYV